MTNDELVALLLENKNGVIFGDSCTFKLGYLMVVLADIADKHPAVRLELIARINEGKK
jgi:hypothetical protein